MAETKSMVPARATAVVSSQLMLLLLLLMVASPSGIVCSCISSEREALSQFKLHLHDPSGKLDSWTGEDCCSWSGVGCDNQTGHVISLDVRDRQLGVRGEISPFLCNLTHLEHLDLSSNNFSCSIPSFMGCLQALRYLNLSSAVFLGIVPPRLGNLAKLISLDLSSNSHTYHLKVYDAVWLGQLLSLHHIDMSRVNLENSPNWFQSLNKLPSLSIIKCKECRIRSLNVRFVNLGSLSSLRQLDFSLNKLTGPIPESLGSLSSLRQLNLSWNDLTGPIPEFLGSLSSLRQLDLAVNKLTGPIPESLGSLLSLRTLSLFRNKLNGSIPTSLGRLSSLESLWLFGNDIGGSVPESLCSLSLLKSLHIWQNDNMNGIVPECLGELTELFDLSLGGHGFVFSESHFAKLAKLRYLRLKSNKSSVLNVPSDWNPPFRLSSLYITSLKVGPQFPTWIQTQDNLKYLRLLENVGITGNLPAWIWNFSSSLRYLDLSSNEMSGNIPDATNSTTLEYIDLSSNKFEGSKWLFTISKMMPTLQYLFLSKNNLVGEIPDCLMKGKVVVDLGSNNFSGKFPMLRQDHCSLQSLHLASNKLHGTLPYSLSRCTNMRLLDLSQNKFTGHIPSWIAESMLSLKFLLLRSNKFSGSIPPSLSRLKSLQLLNLANNNLSGSIPHSIGNIAAMKIKHEKNESLTFSFVSQGYTYMYRYDVGISMVIKGKVRNYSNTKILPLVVSIDLSNNKLSGGIPQEFGDLLELMTLNLSGNHLTGSIPGTIIRLKELLTLDLSRNHLSGRIPQNMSTMTFLSSLNLSFNNLSGRIPTGSQFSTFSKENFMDNHDLCGPPLQSCGSKQNSTVKSGNVDKEEDEMLWFYLSMILGFVVGFWTFYGTLFFKKTWRCNYFQFLSNMDERLYVRIIRPTKRMLK